MYDDLLLLYEFGLYFLLLCCCPFALVFCILFCSMFCVFLSAPVLVTCLVSPSLNYLCSPPVSCCAPANHDADLYVFTCVLLALCLYIPPCLFSSLSDVVQCGRSFERNFSSVNFLFNPLRTETYFCNHYVNALAIEK